MSHGAKKASLPLALVKDTYSLDPSSTPPYKCEERTPARFLDLPLELRYQIYDYVLELRQYSSSKTGSNPTVTRYSIDTAIIRVSKEIHHEVIQILYDKNGVVIIDMDSQVYDIYRKNSRLICAVQNRCVYPLFKNTILRLGGSPLLKIMLKRLDAAEVPQLQQSRTKIFAVAASFVCFRRDMQRFCRDFMLTCQPGENEVHFRLNREANPLLQGLVLHYLKDIRGFGAASLADYHLKRVNDKLAIRMRTPVVSLDEFLKRTKGYEHVYQYYLQQKQFGHALYCAEEGWGYYLWSLSMAIRLRLLSKDYELDWGLKFTDVTCKRIHCSIRLRLLEDAYNMLIRLFADDGLDHARTTVRSAVIERKADGHYYFGLIAVARNSPNAALYSFFRALCESPGHEGASHEINVMEARIASTQEDPQDPILRHNIATIKEVRHQVSCTSPVAIGRIRELEKNWMGIGKPPVFHEDVAKKHCFLEFLAFD